MSTLSPSNSSSNIQGIPEKRDSKVIKAAAYWNNYIGEVTSKSKPPSNPKLMDKPKKIISAGIGERGLKELTSAFEQGKSNQQEDKFTLTRRNSKKLSVDSCNPGLRVNDAKSVFERKFQQTETPRLTRRASSTLERPSMSHTKDKSDMNFESGEGMLSVSKSDSPATRLDQQTSKSNSPPLQKEVSTKLENVIQSVTEPHPHQSKEDNFTDTKKQSEQAEKSLLEPTVTEQLVPKVIKKNEIKEKQPIKETNLKPKVEPASDSSPKPSTSPKPKVKKETL